MELRVGRIVHFVPDFERGECAAAIVIKVLNLDPGAVNLMVFPDWPIGLRGETSGHARSVLPDPDGKRLFSYHDPRSCLRDAIE